MGLSLYAISRHCLHVKIASLSQRIYISDQLKIVLALMYQHTEEIEQSQDLVLLLHDVKLSPLQFYGRSMAKNGEKHYFFHSHPEIFLFVQFVSLINHVFTCI